MRVTEITGSMAEIAEYLAKELHPPGFEPFAVADGERVDLAPKPEIRRPACFSQSGPAEAAQIRMECLRLAFGTEDNLATARAYADFVLGVS